ncbi:MAG TPA: hypothetical protein ENJ00_11655 [Phycisphaerales bacterium]|nr:hypothetical protein [Phycisphaerales bacterium]
MTHRTRALSLALISTLFAGPGLAQDTSTGSPSTATATADLPDGFEVLNRYIKAIGGEEAYRKHTSEQLKGSFTLPAMGVEGTIHIRRLAPASSLLNIELDGLGSVVQGSDGDVAWMAQPGQQPRIVEDELADQIIHEANFYALVEPHSMYDSAETLGIEMYDGVECYIVKLETTWGQHRIALFEVESGLHRKMAIFDTDNPEMPSNVIEYDNYREVGGIMRPFQLTITNAGMEQVIEFDSIEFDVTFDPGTFDRPGTL